MHKEYPILVPSLSITYPENALEIVYAMKKAVPMYPNASSEIKCRNSPSALNN